MIFVLFSLNNINIYSFFLFIEKKAKIKKHKRDIKTFESGVNMYKTFLQMDLNIENQENNDIINITLKNLNTHKNYNIVLEENDKIFKRKYILIFSVYYKSKCMYI